MTKEGKFSFFSDLVIIFLLPFLLQGRDGSPRLVFFERREDGNGARRIVQDSPKINKKMHFTIFQSIKAKKVYD